MRKLFSLLGALSLVAAPPADAEIRLVFAAAQSERDQMSLEIFTDWVERINADGTGVVQIDFRPGMALANPGNFYDRVSDGVVDISWGILTQVAGKFPRMTVLELPFLTRDTTIATGEPFSLGLWDLYSSGMLDAEFDEVVPLFMTTFPQSALHLRAELASLDDLDGTKVIAGGGTYANTLTAIGGVPLSLALHETYEAIQRGTADGRLMAWSGVPPFRLNEVTSYHLEAPLGTAPGAVIINRAAWEGLTPEARAIIERHSGEDMVRRLSNFVIDQTNAIRTGLLAEGHTITPLPAEQIADWMQRTAPARTDWVDETPDGAAVLERFTGFLDAYPGLD